MKKITVKELELLKICVRKKHASAREIHGESLKAQIRSYTTIKTLLDRMVDREFLRRSMHEGAYTYFPEVTVDQAVDRAIDDFVQKMLENSPTPLFTYLSKKGKMKKEEIAEIRKLIDDAEKE